MIWGGVGRYAAVAGKPSSQAPLQLGRPGGYQVQAAIAACHATATEPGTTDWRQIALLYGQLARFSPSAVVELNRAVAIAMADGLPAGLDLVDRIDASGSLRGYYLLPATRADLLRRMRRFGESAVGYRAALELATTDPERRYLARRLAEVDR